MSVKDLLDRIPTEGEFDFMAIRNEIHKEFEQTASSDKRVSLIKLFNAVADAVERTGGLTPPQLEQFRATRKADYKHLIVTEAQSGENWKSTFAHDLLEVTKREIAAGRMAPDDKMHQLAVEGVAELLMIAETEKQPKQIGILGRFMAWKRGT